MAMTKSVGSRPMTPPLFSRDFPVLTNVVIYQGALVAVDAAGYLNPAADTAGLTVVGMAQEEVDATGVASGALSCVVESGMEVEMPATSVTLGMCDGATKLEVVHDGEVDDAAGTANHIACGYAVHYVSATVVGMYIPPFGAGL